MKISDRLLPIAIGGFLLFGVGLFVVPMLRPAATTTTISVTVPKLSPLALEGEAAFNANCSQCHGKNAGGTKAGPPLVFEIYNPGHHGDEAFYRAVKRGSPQHHWPFGNMPPRPGVSDKQIAAIVRYVRELQLANGIVYKKHTM